MNKNKQKEAGFGRLLKNNIFSFFHQNYHFVKKLSLFKSQVFFFIHSSSAIQS